MKSVFVGVAMGVTCQMRPEWSPTKRRLVSPGGVTRMTGRSNRRPGNAGSGWWFQTAGTRPKGSGAAVVLQGTRSEAMASHRIAAIAAHRTARDPGASNRAGPRRAPERTITANSLCATWMTFTIVNLRPKS